MGTRIDSVKTQAQLFCELRSLYLALQYYNDEAQKRLMVVIRDLCAPTYIPDEKRGDFDRIEFADGSTILWDWDNGEFSVDEVRFEYPYGPLAHTPDPLYLLQGVQVA